MTTHEPNAVRTLLNHGYTAVVEVLFTDGNTNAYGRNSVTAAGALFDDYCRIARDLNGITCTAAYVVLYDQYERVLRTWDASSLNPAHTSSEHP